MQDTRETGAAPPRLGIVRLLATYWEATAGFHGQAIWTVAMLAVAGVLEGLAITLLIPVIGRANPPRALPAWWTSMSKEELTLIAVGGFTVAGVGGAVLRAAATRLALRTRIGVEKRMRDGLIGAVLGADWGTFHTVQEGAFAHAVNAEGQATGVGAQSLVTGIGGFIAAIVLALTGALVAPGIAAFTMAFGVVAGLFHRAISRRAHDHVVRLRNETLGASQEVAELVRSAKYARSTGEGLSVTEDAHEASRHLGVLQFIAQTYTNVSRVAFEIGGAVFLGAVLTLAALTAGSLTARALVFLALFYRLIPRILSLQESLDQARTSATWYASWLGRMASLEATAPPPGGARPPVFSDRIELRDAHFAYPGGAHILSGVSATVATKGEFVALVGTSGAGKTTLLDLVTGLLSPTSGAVLIDGVPLSEIDVTGWQSRIGLVLQETPMFSGSVLANIAWRRPVDEARARRCAEMAEALDFIMELPRGFDTPVGERGGRLSGGQRQRIALARALYREPWLLVLDEPTSALDTVSEAAVLRALQHIKGTCTTLLVAHRLSTVRQADRIMVLQDGALTEEGSWDELIGLRGVFAAMVDAQHEEIAVLDAAGAGRP